MTTHEIEREIKVVAFPVRLYECVRDMAEAKETTNRQLIRDAVSRHLSTVEHGLAELGFAPPEGGARKIVRTSFDPQTLDTLREAAEKTGVDASTLTMICLRRHLKVRMVDPGHKKLAAKAEKRQKAKKRSVKKQSQ